MAAAHPQSGSVSRPVTARSRAAARRRDRQDEIVASTRRLFDERGTRSANIDDIARAVGINRAIVYRHFASKEELFALTLADYLAELDGRLEEADDVHRPPVERLAALARAFAGYCMTYPAFVDCALALLGRPGRLLLDEISDAALLRLGRLMAGELGRIADILRRGGVPEADVALTANALYMQVLGVMHLARTGFVVRPNVAGEVGLDMIAEDRILDLVVAMATAVGFADARTDV